MNDVVSYDERPDPGRSLLLVIGKAAADPRVDVDKMTALLEMQQKIMAKDALDQFNNAMAELNARCDLRVAKSGTASLGSKGSYKFARWEDMDAIIRPAMRDLGLWFSFREEIVPEGRMVHGTLHHRGGHTESTSVTLPIDNGPGRNGLQQVGSTLSYGKRYAVELLLNIVREDEDDDGASVVTSNSRRAPPPQAPARELSFIARAETALEAEGNGTKWLQLLQKILKSCETIEDVSLVRTLPNVVAGTKAAPTTIRALIADAFTQAMERLSPQLTPEEAPGHTDLTGTPESVDSFIEANPPIVDLLSDIKEEVEAFDNLETLEMWAKGAGKMVLELLKQQSGKQWQAAVALIDQKRVELGG